MKVFECEWHKESWKKNWQLNKNKVKFFKNTINFDEKNEREKREKNEKLMKKREREEQKREILTTKYFYKFKIIIKYWTTFWKSSKIMKRNSKNLKKRL